MSEATPQKAEGLLNVLTILTIIGASLGVLGSFYFFMGSILWGLVALLGSGIKIFGAIQMRKLAKTGFFMWIAGDLMYVIGSWLGYKAVLVKALAAFSAFGSALGDSGELGSIMAEAQASAVGGAANTVLIGGLVLFAIWAALYGSQMKNLR